MINVSNGLDLLRRCMNHLNEQETYEEATTDKDLADEIEKYFNDSQLVFKEGSEIGLGDRLFVEEQLCQYNNAMIHSLNKLYPCVVEG